MESGTGHDTVKGNAVVPTLGQMLLRFLRAEGQSRSARTVELFGWYELALGVLILSAPVFVASLLDLPALSLQTSNYVRLVGLLVSGLGVLYTVSGRLNARGFVFASMLDRPAVPVIMAILWSRNILPGTLALAFSISDFGSFLWTLSAWLAEDRQASDGELPSARAAAGLFGFTSGVVRNSRTFHPDGRVFLGTVRSLEPADDRLARAAQRLAGSTVLMRIGMGVMKKAMPAWLIRLVPDAPSIASRFFNAATPDEVRLEPSEGDDLDLLCTAGGDRLWKLVLNLAAGGKAFGLHPFDYFRNVYYADVPYRIDEGREDVWIRLVPGLSADAAETRDSDAREQALTNAVVEHATIRMEAQRARDFRAPFQAFAEIRFESEIAIDQETLHFYPVAGRGFEPHGYLTELRRSVYPASVHSRAASRAERERREGEAASARVARYLGQSPSHPLAGGIPMTNGQARYIQLRNFCLVVLAVFVLFGAYAAVRFSRDRPVDYADDVMFFKHGSTGGERTMGIPYWFWVALPEMFPEYLPDKKPGRGYKSFGMIYEKGDDPRYALPDGMSMRNVRGIDVVYLNCAVCHTGSVRDAPGADPRIVTGMPANTLNLGAFEKFLTSIPSDQKFIPQRMLDQIAAMQDNPHRLIEKPDLINRLIFRYYAVDLMREKMLMLHQRLAFIDAGSWGPGRVDTFNAPKALLNFNMTHADQKELMGNADFPSIWNQGPREGMQLHWDGNNTLVAERNLSAAFGTGAYPPTLDADRVQRTAKWLLTAQPIPYPYKKDLALVAQGAPIYKQYCEGCHGTAKPPFRTNSPGDHGVGTVVPIDKIGTDPARMNSYTWLVAVNQGTLYAGYEPDWGFNKSYPQRFQHFRKTNGYANAPLDGIWLRAPYLHNGSVPNLRELLEPSENRSKFFFRGNDVYDPENVGFVSNVGEQGGTRYFSFDTTKPGNGNQGHEGKIYGTELPAAEKRALLEYLKTF